MAASARSRVLVVLDDEVFGAIVYRLIESAGFRPFVVASALEAHALLDGGLDPCVVLFGLTSPDGGRDFIARHGASGRASAIPVIFFTTRTRADEHSPPIASALVAFVQTYCAATSAQNGSSALH